MTRQARLHPEALKNLFIESGAWLQGHFLLSSGLHSDQYLQCALLLADPPQAEMLGAALSRLCDQRPDVVLSPALGGLIIGHEAARALKAKAYFSERENGVMTLRRGFSLNPGQKVIIVEDVITTGKSSQEAIDLAQSFGAEVTAALSIINRSAAPLNLGIAVKSLMKINIPTFAPENCPLCREAKPLVKPGSRKIPC
ncbi:MAG: orotate phosphoribosyltransferase [Elusimicrobia bacterium RIFCSPHIGHO2_02_FULL_57_9]|nr:MAG: orotate phosphoribosyltransferase [Elusimicrobia bacterium RIFCSPHIGHO2_02_FULL_57_9]